MSLLKKPKIVFLIVVLILALLVLMFNGLRYGLEFSGGTQFVLTLDEEVTDLDKLQRITNTISQRLDWSGLKDVKVSSWGERFVTAQVAVSDPEDVARIEEILQKQGRFENIFESEILFTGDDIISVSKDPSKGYGISSAGEDGYRWTLPFVLSTSAARKFAESAYHKCIPTPSGDYDCPKTYFFIDRPKNAIALIPTKIYQEEEFLPMDPLFSGGSQIRADELLQNAGFEFIIVDDVDGNVKNKILELKESKGISQIVVPSGFDTQQLQDLNLDLVVVAKQDPYPWLWSATGLKSVVSLTESITNQNASSVTSSDFKVFYDLMITGAGRNRDEAQEKLDFIYILLGSGSLPVGVESISKETVSPTLGSSFLRSIFIMGILAILAIMIFIYWRYKSWETALPMVIIVCSEVFLVLGFASLIKWELDLAALAGLIAAVGTGIDDQIVVNDELVKEKDEKQEHSLLTRVKRAFFIVFAAAATLLATMLPILLFGTSKLVGFALTTLIGVLIGVFITRPAYAEIAKYLLARDTNKK